VVLIIILTSLVLDQCVSRVNGVKRRRQNLKDQVEIIGLRKRGLDLEVLLRQGLKDKTLGERGSLWCRGN
jgi:hypothetical protein